MTLNNEIAIRLEGLSKVFKIYPKSSDLFKEIVTRRSHHREFWALKDISFDVKRGEVVGIIGRNGAGKSTLLKIIAGLMDYDLGYLEINGQVSAILELGTGFHPEYTGRENIYIAGSMMGWKKSQIERKVDEIIDFAELRLVIDQPFRTYSSGMQARLTFSTAISVDPEIFIVDEALAAGDAAFVEKCILRMGQIIRSGCTVLLVSHNTNLISRFADRAIWIDNGQIVADSKSETVAKKYELSIYAEANAVPVTAPDNEEHRVGDQKIRVTDVHISGDKVSESVFLHGSELTFEIEVESSIESKTAGLGLLIYRADGICVWTSSNLYHIDNRYNVVTSAFHIKPGKSWFRLSIPNIPFNSGNYYINIGIEPYYDTASVSDYHDYLPRYRKFSIIRRDNLILGKVCDTPSIWSARGNIVFTRTEGRTNFLGEVGTLKEK